MRFLLIPRNPPTLPPLIGLFLLNLFTFPQSFPVKGNDFHWEEMIPSQRLGNALPVHEARGKCLVSSIVFCYDPSNEAKEVPSSSAAPSLRQFKLLMCTSWGLLPRQDCHFLMRTLSSHAPSSATRTSGKTRKNLRSQQTSLHPILWSAQPRHRSMLLPSFYETHLTFLTAMLPYQIKEFLTTTIVLNCLFTTQCTKVSNVGILNVYYGMS